MSYIFIFIVFFNLIQFINGTFVHIERVPHDNIDDGIEHAVRLTKGKHSM